MPAPAYVVITWALKDAKASVEKMKVGSQQTDVLRQQISNDRRETDAVVRLFIGDTAILETEQSERSYLGMPLAKNFGKKKAAQFWIDFYEEILFSSKGN